MTSSHDVIATYIESAGNSTNVYIQISNFVAKL